MSNFQAELENRLNGILSSIKKTKEELRSKDLLYHHGGHTQTIKKDIEFGRVHAGRLCEGVEKEYAIIAEFNALLPKLTPETYWVYQIESKDHLKKIIKERKTLEALYRRKIKSMRVLVSHIQFYGRN